ncbi:MAG: hypothetical protein M1839_001109 [Geoglossum umbratile]|nr:MAG: hypothetical protein M1839_001109 [Geoglossum umbratile]
MSKALSTGIQLADAGREDNRHDLPCAQHRILFPEELPVSAYTHLNFAFASINPSTFEIAPASESDVKLYSRLTNLKTANPGLQVWISIGGWTMNDPDQPTASTFSDLAGSTANQQRFFSSLISFMTTYGFDGVDVDWEYPGADDRSGRPEDFANYPTFLRNLRNAFHAAGHNYGVTITCPSSFWYLQHFDIVALEKEVDWFNMMMYDLHGTWDSTDVWTGPYVKAHTNMTEIDASLKLLWRNNINPAKVVLGLGFYGRSFKLKNPSCATAGCEFSGGAPAGPCTGEAGTLGYTEIMGEIASGAKPVLDSAAAAQILVYGGDNWVSFDDATTLKMKIDYANKVCLGGTMVWAASLDDTSGSAASALSSATGQIGKSNIGIVIPNNALSICVWTKCAEACPAGFSMANNDNGLPLSYSTAGCPPPDGKIIARRFCCPITDMPTCNWRGRDESSSICNGQCQSGEITVATAQTILGGQLNFCPLGGQLALCCTSTRSTSQFNQCTWAGSPPLCALFSDDAASCPSGQVSLTETLRGDGGSQACTRGYRSLCCPNPPPFTNCQWYQNAFHGICTPGCPSGKISLAVDGGEARCASGQGSYCCDYKQAVTNSNDPQVLAFADVVSAWISNPVCNANDPFGDINDLGRRDVSDHDLPRRAPKSVDNVFMTNALLPVLGIGLGLFSQRQRAMQQVWDNSIAQAPPEFRGLTTLNLQTYLSQSQADPADDLSMIFCMSPSGFAGVVQRIAAQTQVCEVVRGVSKREFSPSKRNTDLSKRRFSPAMTLDVARIPTAGRLISRIVSSSLRPEYFRWFQFGVQDEFELEIVYLLGLNPGQIDTSLQQTPDQNFAVIHIHINGGNANNGGLGIGQINIRHGTRIGRTTGGQWRVETVAQHGVEIFSCPNRFPSILAYRPNGLPRRQWPNDAGGQLMEQFIDHLNGLDATLTGMFEGHSPSLLLRDGSQAPVLGPHGEPQYVINQATSRWTAPNTRTASFEPGSLRIYDPRFRGDLPPNMFTNDFIG